jgi:hypothetical protein
MSTVNGKLLEFFVHIPKLEVDGSNWVIFKDHFAFAAATTDLEKHINGTGATPNPHLFWVDNYHLLQSKRPSYSYMRKRSLNGWWVRQ